MWIGLGVRRHALVNKAISSGVHRSGSCSHEVTDITSDICSSISCLVEVRSTKIRTLRAWRSAGV